MLCVKIFLSSPAKFHRLQSQSSFDVVTELRRMNKISLQGERDLKHAIAVSCEARLNVSVKREGNAT